MNNQKCVGCGKCASVCPKKLFKIIEKVTKGPVARCSNYSQNKPQIKKNCSFLCFNFVICAIKFPSQSIDVSS